MVAGLTALAAIVFSGHAEAHSFRRVHHYHRQVWHHWRHINRSYSYRMLHRWLAKAADGNSDVIATAERFLGDRNPTGFRGPWCKAFINLIARKTGHYFNRSLRAIDGLRMGVRVRVPRAGDLAVFQHHITIFAGYGGRGFLGLGGNQTGHRVTVSSYPIGRVIAWIRLE